MRTRGPVEVVAAELPLRGGCPAAPHDRCRHLIGAGARPSWRDRRVQRLLVACTCTCHAGCAVQVGATGSEEQLWLRCSCFDHRPAVAAAAERDRRASQRSAVVQALLQRGRPSSDPAAVRDAIRREFDDQEVAPLPGEVDRLTRLFMLARRPRPIRDVLVAVEALRPLAPVTRLVARRRR